MASGKVHERVTLTLSPFALLIVYLYTSSIAISLCSFLGCLLGLFIEPDLDVDHITESENKFVNVSKVIGSLWVLMWLPYAKAIPHRHPISHVPAVGTIVRYLYLGLCIFIPTTMVGILIDDVSLFATVVTRHSEEIIWVVIGNTMADYGHWMLDL